MGLEKDNLENEVVRPVYDMESDDLQNNDLENDILVNNNPEMDLFLGSIATVRENRTWQTTLYPQHTKHWTNLNVIMILGFTYFLIYSCVIEFIKVRREGLNDVTQKIFSHPKAIEL